MEGSEQPRDALAVCQDCESVQPVEVSPETGIRAVGNPSCQCGTNRFRLLD